MTDTDRDLWRQAFVLYDSHREMPNTEDAWTHFITAVADFANAGAWRTHPLTKALAYAVMDAVEGDVMARVRANAERPAQLSFL